MNERIKELAEQAGLKIEDGAEWVFVVHKDFFEKFSALVRQDEREACAKLCEDYAKDKWNLYKGRSPYTGEEDEYADPHVEGESCGAIDCAEAIRGRTE
jgi:hypothetical protein